MQSTNRSLDSVRMPLGSNNGPDKPIDLQSRSVDDMVQRGLEEETEAKGFMDLPGEIRNIVYRYVLFSEETFPWELGRHCWVPRHWIVKTKDWVPFHDISLRKWPRQQPLPSLSAASKTIRAELLSIYYSEFVLDLDNPSVSMYPRGEAALLSFKVEPLVSLMMPRAGPYLVDVRRIFVQILASLDGSCTEFFFTLKNGGKEFELAARDVRESFYRFAAMAKDVTERSLGGRPGPWNGSHLFVLLHLIQTETTKCREALMGPISSIEIEYPRLLGENRGRLLRHR